jgi:hypothetical protein
MCVMRVHVDSHQDVGRGHVMLSLPACAYVFLICGVHAYTQTICQDVAAGVFDFALHVCAHVHAYMYQMKLLALYWEGEAVHLCVCVCVRVDTYAILA